MDIQRAWAMPNSNTFSIPPIGELIAFYVKDAAVCVDPFANSNTFANVTNDIDPQFDTDYHMDATEFLQQLPSEYADVVLYDPPYSPRQVSECYRKLGKTVDMKTTQASYWSKQKREIARIVKRGGMHHLRLEQRRHRPRERV